MDIVKLKSILKQLVAASYTQMGENWCISMINEINSIPDSVVSKKKIVVKKIKRKGGLR